MQWEEAVGDLATLETDERCRFASNVAAQGSQIYGPGGLIISTCLPGQFNGLENGGEADRSFVGCPNQCPTGKYVSGTASRNASSCRAVHGE